LLDTSVQSLYAILDKGNTYNVTRTDLLQRTLTEIVPASGPVIRNVTSSTTLDWNVKSGWYIDLDVTSSPGERVVSRAIVRPRSVIFTTAVPSTDRCEPGGSSWFIGLSTETGGRYSATGLFLGSDGVKSVVGMVTNPTIVSDNGNPGTGSGNDALLGAGTSGKMQKVNVAKDILGRRTAWREIVR
jgi:type IV pilus assembly protein PilY1